MENNLKFHIIPISDLFTEDEWANFQIDMWVAQRDYELNRELNKDVPVSAVSGKTVTITLTKANYCGDIGLG